MLPLTFLLSYTFLFSTALAGSVDKGGNCTQANNRLEVGTYQFDGDCDSTSFCSSQGICEAKGCRRDQFPFGYPQDDPNLPPFCSSGQFCPDEEDACQDLLAVGSPCQLNRDDECEAPPNFKELANSRFGENHNGSVCLNFQCMWANVTVGLPCVVENTAYIAYGANNQEFIDIVSRGNCVPGLYCDSQQLVCMQTLVVGASCTADKQCDSLNCLDSQVCGQPADSAKRFAVWVYVIVCIGIFGGIFGTLITLFFVHRRQREDEREKRTQYWREQNAFRQNIIQLRETARGSMISLPFGANTNGTNSARSTMYSRDFITSEDSQLPMLQNQATKGSGLRHNLSDDGTDNDDYDQVVMARDGEGKRRTNGAF